MRDGILYIGTEIITAKTGALDAITDEQLLVQFADQTLAPHQLVHHLYDVFLGNSAFPPAKNQFATRLHEIVLRLVQIVQTVFSSLLKIDDFVPGFEIGSVIFDSN